MAHYVELNLPKKSNAAEEKHTFVTLPIWACGFRPFFLGAAFVAAFLLIFWLFVFFAAVPAGGAAGPIGWHSHEMIFGFATAVIAGFLLTAVPKWTRTPTVKGGVLAALFGLWALGRVAMAAAHFLPYLVVAIADFLFLPALALAISLPIIRARTPRNLGFVPLLFGLATANALFHLHHLGLTATSQAALNAGLAIIITIIAIVGGRVIPFFTVNRLGLASPNRHRPIDIAALSTTVAWGLSFAFWPAATFTGVLALLAGLTNLARMHSWATFKTFRVPLLWVLHIGYAFVGLGLTLLGLSILDIAATRSVALHALTTGAIGILCLGMMARVALGHAGRPLKAHRITAISFALLTIAALIRVLSPWLLPAFYSEGVIASGIIWAAAWLLFLFIYAPILLRPRADGRPG